MEQRSIFEEENNLCNNITNKSNNAKLLCVKTSIKNDLSVNYVDSIACETPCTLGFDTGRL